MRLFVAVWPPAHVLDRIEALARPERAGVRWTSRDQWHVTLRFLGVVDDPEQVAAALGAAELPAAHLALGPRTERLGNGVLCLPAAGLDDLATAVHAATAGIGEAEDRPFHGHLTLARVKRGGVARLAGEPFEAEAPVRSVALVQSRPHPHGARYEDLATFPTA